MAGEFPLTPDGTYLIGRALAHDLRRRNPRPKVVIGQDTRESSRWIADRIGQGLISAGAEVSSAGVITTPGVAYLARSRKYDAGMVISASHNPWPDNGIKVFGSGGYKLPDAEEIEIEREIFSLLQSLSSHPAPSENPLHTLPGDAGLREAYIHWLTTNVSTDLAGLKVLVDCANGAATAEAPEMFEAWGYKQAFYTRSQMDAILMMAVARCIPKRVAAAVAEEPGAYDLGITFDGDADRALFSDENGKVVNGDGVLLLAARDMHSRGALTGSTVVATTMSNMGLEIALREAGIRMLRANVGDKYVLEEMLKTGAILGGEQSGHIIFRDGEATTGDGLLTALRIMEVIKRSGRSMGDLVSDLKVYPQTIQNIKVRSKVPFQEVPEIQREIDSAQAELEGKGRVVVRYSGTEALARVMIEAESVEKMRMLADRISGAIRKSLS